MWLGGAQFGRLFFHMHMQHDRVGFCRVSPLGETVLANSRMASDAFAVCDLNMVVKIDVCIAKRGARGKSHVIHEQEDVSVAVIDETIDDILATCMKSCNAARIHQKQKPLNGLPLPMLPSRLKTQSVMRRWSARALSRCRHQYKTAMLGWKSSTTRVPLYARKTIVCISCFGNMVGGLYRTRVHLSVS